MFIPTKYNGYINTMKIENFKVQKMRKSDKYGVLALNEECSYIIELFETIEDANEYLNILIKTIKEA